MQPDELIHLDQQDPKRRAKSERKHLLALAAGRCFYCGVEGANTLDHIIPRSKVGLKAKNNRVACCVSCNRAKSDMEWLTWYRAQPFHCPTREANIRAMLGEWGLLPDFTQQPIEPSDGVE